LARWPFIFAGLVAAILLPATCLFAESALSFGLGQIVGTTYGAVSAMSRAHPGSRHLRPLQRSQVPREEPFDGRVVARARPRQKVHGRFDGSGGP